MAPKRGDRVAPPAGRGEWDLRFATGEAAKGWESLCQQAAGNTAVAWNELRNRPAAPIQTSRHHQLKGRLAYADHRGAQMEQWQYEVTGAGRIWYLVDIANHTLWLRYASPGHPNSAQ